MNVDFFLLLFFKPCLYNLYLIPSVPDCVLRSGKEYSICNPISTGALWGFPQKAD